MIDAYALTLAALLLTAGSIADLVGRRRVFAIGIVVFTGGSLLCGLATDSVTFLALARALQGTGGAIMFATSLALLAQAFAAATRGTAFGVFGAVTGVAVAVGPVLGGVITSGLSWRWIFFVNLPIGIAALIVTLRGRRVPRAGRAAARLGRLRHVQPRPGRARLRADPLAAGRLGLDDRGRLALPPSVVLLAAFVVVELRQRPADVRLRLCSSRRSTAALIAALGDQRRRCSRCSPTW